MEKDMKATFSDMTSTGQLTKQQIESEIAASSNWPVLKESFDDVCNSIAWEFTDWLDNLSPLLNAAVRKFDTAFESKLKSKNLVDYSEDGYIWMLQWQRISSEYPWEYFSEELVEENDNHPLSNATDRILEKILKNTDGKYSTDLWAKYFDELIVEFGDLASSLVPLDLDVSETVLEEVSWLYEEEEEEKYMDAFSEALEYTENNLSEEIEGFVAATISDAMVREKENLSLAMEQISRELERILNRV